MATISSLLADHVSLRVRSVDRIFLAGHVPRLQPDRMLVGFLNQRAGGTIPSPAMLGKILRAYVKEINAFAKAREIPVVRFTNDMVKEDVARPHMQKAQRAGRSGVVMLGVAHRTRPSPGRYQSRAVRAAPYPPPPSPPRSAASGDAAAAGASRTSGAVV